MAIKVDYQSAVHFIEFNVATRPSELRIIRSESYDKHFRSADCHDPRDECSEAVMVGPVGFELFAGCGGLSTGLLNAGLHIAAGFETNKRAVAAYNYNHNYRGSRGFESDLSTATGSELLQLTGVKRVDLIIGGPPCQPISIAGKLQGRQDIRADLVGHFIRLVRELKPSVFLLENVPNLAAISDGAFFQKSSLLCGGSVTASNMACSRLLIMASRK